MDAIHLMLLNEWCVKQDMNESNAYIVYLVGPRGSTYTLEVPLPPWQAAGLRRYLVASSTFCGPLHLSFDNKTLPPCPTP